MLTKAEHGSVCASGVNHLYLLQGFGPKKDSCANSFAQLYEMKHLYGMLSFYLW